MRKKDNELEPCRARSILARRRRTLQRRNHTWTSSGALIGWDRFDDRCVLRFENLAIIVYPGADGSVRLVAADTGDMVRPPSFAVTSTMPAAAPALTVDEGMVSITGSTVVLEVERSTGTFHLKPRKRGGKSGAVPFVASLRFSRGPDDFRMETALSPQDHIYGLGEKMGGLDKRGRTWKMWNTDEGNQKPSADPLYQTIPFYLQFSPGRTTGVFVDSAALSWFDMGHTDPAVAAVEVRDDFMDCYFFTGQRPGEVIESYTALTGRMPLPPEWALGFQQCRYSYYPERQVRKIAATMRSKKIPCDVLYLDIHYMDGYRVFTWDERRFPDPKTLLSDLRDQGFRVVTIVDPGVKAEPGYRVYRTGADLKAFCRFPEGEYYVGKVWPGEAVFPDFSRETVRRWWAEQHGGLLGRGVAGIWNDMNEPADFTGSRRRKETFTVPNTVLMDNDGYPCSFLRNHNAYGITMCRATRLAFPLFRKEERGFVLTRSGFAGVQRYAAVWTGDNASWWEHLAVSVPMLMNMGISGVAFVGADTGGFQDNAPPDLFARWASAAAFTPFFRAHTGNDTAAHEPWSFGPETEAVCRTVIQLRYRLMPYIYTAFEESSRTGQPVMRALVLDFPDDERVHRLNDQYLFGPALLAAPIVQSDKEHRAVYLPRGRWYDFWTGNGYDGPVDILAHAPLERVPLFVRGGSIVPRESVRQHTGEAGDGIIRLDIYPDADGRAAGWLYTDAGDGFEYRDGKYTRCAFSFEKGRLRIDVNHAGYPGRWKKAVASLSPGEDGRREANGRDTVPLDLSKAGSTLVKIR